MLSQAAKKNSVYLVAGSMPERDGEGKDEKIYNTSYVFANQIITAFGGRVNDETFRQSQIYFFWITCGLPFYIFGQAMNAVIRADGSPKFAMVS